MLIAMQPPVLSKKIDFALLCTKGLKWMYSVSIQGKKATVRNETFSRLYVIILYEQNGPRIGLSASRWVCQLLQLISI